MNKLTLAVLAAALFALPAALASAATTHAKRLPAPARDCVADGWLGHHYAKTALRRAIPALTTRVAHHAVCRTRLRRVLKHGGDGRLAIRGSAHAVIRDCADNGWIDHRYPLSVLRASLRRVPADVDEYTRCTEIIRAELRARR
jgi:hypothetical protein